MKIWTLKKGPISTRNLNIKYREEGHGIHQCLGTAMFDDVVKQLAAGGVPLITDR